MVSAEPFLVFGSIAISLIFCLHIVSNKLQRATVKCSFERHFPQVRYSFMRFSILDGFINLIRLRRGGLKIIDEIVSRYGPNFRCSIATQEFVVVSDPIVIKKVLNSKNSGLLNKPKYLYELIFSASLSNGLLIADVGTWFPHRKTISRAFAYNELANYVEIIDGEVTLLMKSTRSNANSTKGFIDGSLFRALMNDHSLAALIGIIFGPECRRGCERELAEFQQAFKRVKELVLERFHRPKLLIPRVWILHRNKRELDVWLEIMNKFSRKMIQAYKRKCEGNAFIGGGVTYPEHQMENELLINKDKQFSNSLSGCMVEQMITAGNSDQEILDEVNMFFVMGSSTIRTAVDFLLFHLARNISHQAACRAEVEQMLDTHERGPNLAMTMDRLSQLKFLERCILESLRLSPPVPAFARRIDTPVETHDDCIVETGRTMLILPWAVHRNPKHFPNPEIFDPDRFLPENVKRRHSHTFIPFSMGPRNCIGYKLAIMELKIIAARILKCFELTTIDKPDDVKILFDVTLKPERPYNVMFKIIK